MTFRLLKSLFFSIIFLFFAGVFTPPTYASTKTIDALTSPGTNLQKFILGEDILTTEAPQGMLTTLANGFTIMALGAKDQNGNVISRGATGHLFALSDAMYQTPAASAKQYLAYLGERSKLTTPAYAQSKGAVFLFPVIKVWEAARNVVYVFFVIIFVAIGFMIMFRSKLNPQTVVNIQISLPKIVISLILVTFSFAICGLIVDIAYLGNEIIKAIFQKAFIINGTSYWSADATPFSLIAAADIGSNLSNALQSLGQILAGSGPAVLFNVIIAMTIVSTSFKIFFSLLTKYISIFIIAILSPFAILTSALPNNNAGINTFKQLISAVLVFPATLFMINLAFYFSNYAKTVSADFQTLDPFRLVDFVNPAIVKHDIAIATIAGLISLGVLMAAAQVPQVIESSLNLKPTIGAGTGQEIGGALRKIPLIGGMIG